MNRTGSAIQTQNKRRAIEGTKHNGHARVLLHVRSGLVAAAGKVKPNHPLVGQHTKRVHTFGRNIYPTVYSGCADKKNFLCLNEGTQWLGKCVVLFAHEM